MKQKDFSKRALKVILPMKFLTITSLLSIKKEASTIKQSIISRKASSSTKIMSMLTSALEIFSLQERVSKRKQSAGMDNAWPWVPTISLHTMVLEKFTPSDSNMTRLSTTSRNALNSTKNMSYPTTLWETFTFIVRTTTKLLSGTKNASSWTPTILVHTTDSAMFMERKERKIRQGNGLKRDRPSNLHTHDLCSP